MNDLGWTIQSRTPKQPTISESISLHPGEIYLAEFPFYKKKMSDNYPVENICLQSYCKKFTWLLTVFIITADIGLSQAQNLIRLVLELVSYKKFIETNPINLLKKFLMRLFPLVRMQS